MIRGSRYGTVAVGLFGWQTHSLGYAGNRHDPVKL
jgi:hypothetical protein